MLCSSSLNNVLSVFCSSRIASLLSLECQMVLSTFSWNFLPQDIPKITWLLISFRFLKVMASLMVSLTQPLQASPSLLGIRAHFTIAHITEVYYLCKGIGKYLERYRYITTLLGLEGKSLCAWRVHGIFSFK